MNSNEIVTAVKETSAAGKQNAHISPGFRQGMLTVTEATGQRKSRYMVWECRCDCGKTVQLDTRSLQRGSVTDCGCQVKISSRQVDLTGRRFGKLLCLEPANQKDASGSALWHCQCECGQECLASAKQLRDGTKKSCGCLRTPPRKQYEGMQFGQLTVLEYAGKSGGVHQWKCKCSCGNETIVSQSLLQNGKTRSCGCYQAGNITRNLKLCDGTSVTKLEATKKHRRISNTSGHTGVYENKRTGRWAAQITFKGKTYYLGSYEDIQDAIKARMRGEEMHDEFLEWYYREQRENSDSQMKD